MQCINVYTEKWTSGTGQNLLVHTKDSCKGPHCPIHNPSDHHMKDWPLHWRDDRKIMERICIHGVGHPDPDDISDDSGIHGCCGCCDSPGVQDSATRPPEPFPAEPDTMENVLNANMMNGNPDMVFDEKPEPPLSRIIQEGDCSSKCKICGSSRAWKVWPFVKSSKCIQPKCKNYYKK